MKPGLAILPLEVWADVSHPLLTRQILAQIADNNGDPGFTEKLQKLLHGCGKHSLRYIDISSKPPDKSTKESKIPECRALAVSPNGNCTTSYVRYGLATYKECELPETEMPHNIKTFKQLAIEHLDDEVLDFLNKIKSLFTNVYLEIIRYNIRSMKSANDMHALFTHLIPMLGSIRRICCDNECMELLESKFPGTLALAKELVLSLRAERTFIPAYSNWLNAPQDFNFHGPRFLVALAKSETIFAFVDAIREQFLTAVASSAFVIFLQFKYIEQHLRAEEFTIENVTTKEKLTVRNASFKLLKLGIDIHYVEIVRNPIGADACMREWIKEWAYYEKKYNGYDNEANNEILICNPTIGRITKQAEDKADGEQDEAGPSTSTKK